MIYTGMDVNLGLLQQAYQVHWTSATVRESQKVAIGAKSQRLLIKGGVLTRKDDRDQTGPTICFP